MMLKLIAGLALFTCFPLHASAQVPIEASTSSVATTTAVTQESRSTSAIMPPPKPTNEGIEATVRAYFPSAPIMADIARCESKFRQYADSGNPLHGGAGGAMIGVFQIHETVHTTYAQSLGMDIYTLEGNLAYAKRLYDSEGTSPWLSSMPCWGAALPDSVHGTSGGPLTSTLTMGIISSEVLTLQKMLNAAGFILATEGPGSPGQETTKFGALTRVAVRSFQCAKNIVCSGDEYTTGYGMVGVKTRTALLAAPTVTQTPVNQESNTAAEITRLLRRIEELTAQLNDLKAKSGA